MKDEKDSLILFQTGEVDFLTQIGEFRFLILIMVGKECTKVLMSIE